MTRGMRSGIVLTILFAVALAPLPAGGVAGFGDVPDGAFYTEAVQWMVNNEITTGKTDTCFAPGDAVTRGQAAAFLWRMEGSPTGSPAHPFTDVAASWQQEPVAWMAAEEITTGTSDTTFSPDKTVTRGELAAFLHRLAGSPDAPPPTQFTDVVKAWQVTPVGWMVTNEITTGTTATTFEPEKSVTRGQIATFLYRYKDKPAVTVDPDHPAIPACDAQVPGPSTFGTLFLTESTTLIQNHDGNIVIGADNITLDCAGHTLTGPGRTSGVAGIDVNQRTGVTVKNCILRDFNDAFRVHDSSGNSFIDNTMATLRQGFILIRSDDNVLRGNMVSDANDFFGIQLDRSNGNTLTDNTVVESEHGFILYNSDNNTLTGNTASRNTTGVGGRVGGNGFGVSVDSNFNLLSGNVSTDNIVGFAVFDDATGNTLSNNQALRNGKWGILDTTSGAGDQGTGNTYQGNGCSGSGWGPSEPGGLC